MCTGIGEVAFTMFPASVEEITTSSRGESASYVQSTWYVKEPVGQLMDTIF